MRNRATNRQKQREKERERERERERVSERERKGATERGEIKILRETGGQDNR